MYGLRHRKDAVQAVRLHSHLIVALLVLGVLLVAVACGSQPAQSPGEPSAQADEGGPEPTPGDSDVLLIGAPINMTGWMAAYDGPPLEGARLAVDKINAEGGVLGRQLDLLVLDGKTDPATVGHVALELIERGVEAIMAPCDFDIGAPAAQAAQEAGLVGISTCATSPLYGSHVLGDKQFALAAWNTTISAGAAQLACEEMGWTRAATITDTSTEYTQSLGDKFVEAYEHFGCEIVSDDTYLQGDMQIDAQIGRLRNLSEAPDLIFISCVMPDCAMMVRELRAAGFDTPIMSGDALDTSEFYEAVGPELGNDIYVVTHSFVGPEHGSSMQDFLKRYEAAYGRLPDTAYVVMGWDVIHVLARAMEAAGTTDGDAVAEAIRNSEFDLLSGKTRWSSAEEGHEPLKEVFALEVKDGATHLLGRVQPSWVPEP